VLHKFLRMYNSRLDWHLVYFVTDNGCLPSYTAKCTTVRCACFYVPKCLGAKK
jgi:hypothetical protein